MGLPPMYNETGHILDLPFNQPRLTLEYPLMPFELNLTEEPSQRRAKIVATLGPASNTEPVFRDLVRAGVDVVRLNFSHGTHEEKMALIKMEQELECLKSLIQNDKTALNKIIEGMGA